MELAFAEVTLDPFITLSTARLYPKTLSLQESVHICAPSTPRKQDNATAVGRVLVVRLVSFASTCHWEAPLWQSVHLVCKEDHALDSSRHVLNTSFMLIEHASNCH